MTTGGLVLVALLVLVVLACAGAALYFSRLRTLTGRVGSFSCGLRYLGQAPSSDVVGGVAQYGAGRLDWWRQVSLAPRAEASWSRSGLVVLGRRTDPAHDGMYLVRCRHEGEEFEVVISPAACAGLVSWLEAAPVDVSRVF